MSELKQPPDQNMRQTPGLLKTAFTSASFVLSNKMFFDSLFFAPRQFRNVLDKKIKS